MHTLVVIEYEIQAVKLLISFPPADHNEDEYTGFLFNAWKAVVVRSASRLLSRPFRTEPGLGVILLCLSGG